MLFVTGLFGLFATASGQNLTVSASAPMAAMSGVDISARGLGWGGWPYPGWPRPPTPGACRCGSPCTNSWGGGGTCQADGQCLATFVPPNCGVGGGTICAQDVRVCPNGKTVSRTGPNCEFAPCDDPVICTMDAKICPNGKSVGRVGPNCEFAPCDDDSVVCTMDAKVCPDGRTVGRVGPNCEFAPCEGGNSGSSCRCGSVCLTSSGGIGVCQSNGQCGTNNLFPICNGNDQCRRCGDSCTRNGQSGFCGNNGVCRIGNFRPPCDLPGNCPVPACIALYCPPDQQEMQYVNGCPTCPICRGTSGSTCFSDASCPVGQECVTVGLYRRCQPRVSGQRCFSNSWPFSLSAESSITSSSSSVAFGAGSSLYPWNQCPSGQTCVNGVCQSCPLLNCFNPPCYGGVLIPSTLDNGCPGCPRCSTGSAPCTGLSCFLPCCTAWQVYNPGVCRQCGTVAY